MMHSRFYMLLILTFLLVSCNSQSSIKSSSSKQSEKPGSNVPREYNSGDVITKGFLDKSGDMWFTSTREGVFRYNGESFTNFTEEDGLCGDQVWSVMQDKDGLIWFSTVNGMCQFDGETFRNIPIPRYDVETEWLTKCFPIVNPNAPVTMIQDRKGDFWIGSNGAGAYHYDGETFTSLLSERGKRMPDSLHHNVVLSIIEDKRGDIWFSSFSHGGISRFDGNEMTHFGVQDGIGDDMIAFSYLDKNQDLWFGTRAGGMTSYDGEKFTQFYKPKGSCSNNMAVILEDSQDRFWVSSYTGGSVCLFDGETFSPLDIDGSEKLVDIKCITEDKDGNIWFGGRYGILYRYDGKQLKDYTAKGK